MEIINYSENQKEIIKPNLIKKYTIRGIIVGIILAVINGFTLGFGGGFLFRFILVFFVRNSSQSHPTCNSGSGCWGMAIMAGSILFVVLTPLFFALFAYIKDRENYPWSWKKISILTSIFLLIFVINLWGFLEIGYETLLMNEGSLIHRSNYKSLDECNSLIYTGSDLDSAKGDCYGYFASKNDNKDLCYQVVNSGKLLSIEGAIASCLSVYSLSKNDIGYCKDLKHGYDQSCMFRYLAFKGDRKGCDSLNQNYTKERCMKWVNPGTYLILKYGELKGGPSVNMGWYWEMNTMINESQNLSGTGVIEPPNIQSEMNTKESLKETLESLYNYYLSIKRNSSMSVVSNSIQDDHFGEEFQKSRDIYYEAHNDPKDLSLQKMDYLFCNSFVPDKFEANRIEITGNEAVIKADEYIKDGSIHLQIPIYAKWNSEKSNWEITKVDCDNYRRLGVINFTHSSGVPQSFPPNDADKIVINSSSNLSDLVIKDVFQNKVTGFLQFRYCNAGKKTSAEKCVISVASPRKLFPNHLPVPNPGECKLSGNIDLRNIEVYDGNTAEITVTADPSNLVREANENNNILKKTVSFKKESEAC